MELKMLVCDRCGKEFLNSTPGAEIGYERNGNRYDFCSYHCLMDAIDGIGGFLDHEAMEAMENGESELLGKCAYCGNEVYSGFGYTYGSLLFCCKVCGLDFSEKYPEKFDAAAHESYTDYTKEYSSSSYSAPSHSSYSSTSSGYSGSSFHSGSSSGSSSSGSSSSNYFAASTPTSTSYSSSSSSSSVSSSYSGDSGFWDDFFDWLEDHAAAVLGTVIGAIVIFLIVAFSINGSGSSKEKSSNQDDTYITETASEKSTKADKKKSDKNSFVSGTFTDANKFVFSSGGYVFDKKEKTVTVTLDELVNNSNVKTGSLRIVFGRSPEPYVHGKTTELYECATQVISQEGLEPGEKIQPCQWTMKISGTERYVLGGTKNYPVIFIEEYFTDKNGKGGWYTMIGPYLCSDELIVW